jgi:hypothetical protein
MRSVLLAMGLLMSTQALRADAQSPPAAPPAPCDRGVRPDAKPRYDIDARELLFDTDKFAGYDKSAGKAAPPQRIDRPQPLSLKADKLIYDKNRVIAQGNVEISYNNYILTADKVIYDQCLNKLTAEGNAQLKDSNGQITRADLFEATDDFRDAFVARLPPTKIDADFPDRTAPREIDGPRKFQ